MNENDDQPMQAAGSRWTDTNGQEWEVSLTPGRLGLRGAGGVVTLNGAELARDLMVFPLADGVLFRLENFNLRAAFVLSRADAESALRTLGQARVSPAEASATPSSEPTTHHLALFPRVSPLAIWSLICSSLAFVPLAGVIPAAATVILLILHRRRVRRQAAWGHSRAVCAVAVGLLILGLGVSAIGSLWLARNLAAPQDPAERAPLELHDTSAGESDAGSKSPLDHAAVPTTTPQSTLAQAGNTSAEPNNWALIGLGLMVILFSLTIHEAAHAITAWWLGDDFARRLGRVTLNPAAHIDPFGTIILPLILHLSNAPVFGYAKPVPVRSELLRHPRRDDMLVSLAGPGSNLLLAVISLAALIGMGGLLGLLQTRAEVGGYSTPYFFEPVTASGFVGAQVFAGAATFLRMSFAINLFLAFFNLIPIPPLDGSWVLGHMFPRTVGPLMDRLRPFGMIIFAVAVFGGVFKYLLLPAVLMLVPGLLLLSWCTPF